MANSDEALRNVESDVRDEAAEAGWHGSMECDMKNEGVAIVGGGDSGRLADERLATDPLLTRAVNHG